MATVVVEADSEPSCSLPNPAAPSPSLSHLFLDSKFYLLVVIGELVTEEHLRRAIANIERGEVAAAERAERTERGAPSHPHGPGGRPPPAARGAPAGGSVLLRPLPPCGAGERRARLRAPALLFL